MQRVAVARALAASPALVLADEPTGDLDQANARSVLEALHHLARERGAALVIATHSEAIARVADRRAAMVDGRVASIDDVGGRAELVRALGLRPLRRHAGRTLLTLLGVAAGVAVYVGIDLAAESSIRSFSAAAREVAGPATLRVHHLPLPLSRIASRPARPVRGSRRSRSDARRLGARAQPDGTAFTILGVDLIGDPVFAARRSRTRRRPAPIRWRLRAPSSIPARSTCRSRSPTACCRAAPRARRPETRSP